MKCAFVGKKNGNFNVIKMHVTTIKKTQDVWKIQTLVIKPSYSNHWDFMVYGE
jgi:hypothetical protein